MKAEFIKVVLTCAAAAASVASGSLALAQAPAAAAAAPPSPRNPRQAYPAQLTETRRQVQRFTLTPIGEIDGVILADGTEVHLPPHLTAQLLKAVKIGDSMVSRGY